MKNGFHRKSNDLFLQLKYKRNNMRTMTREQAMEKFMLAKRKKQERIETLAQKMKEDYESKTGLQANYFFAM